MIRDTSQSDSLKKAAVIVAHPDDETIWAGGTILLHPDWQWTVVVLCRGNDPDRAPKFHRAVKKLGATGMMGNLDDGPEQLPLPEVDLQQTILSLLLETRFNLILTHSPYGEYTRHLRHEETSRAVISLWEEGSISANEIWMFAYEDGGKSYLPRPIKNVHLETILPKDIWQLKYRIITELYGFGPESFEAKTTPKEETFWCFRSVNEFHKWLNKRGKKL
jgi:LmbE family N-acetylglucosaminyl deacetylase